jgi:predicted RNA-binding Zn-ribbon protein involved in translation (DUF1610 family)
VYCYSCGKQIATAQRVDFRAECPSCGRDVHICVNCGLYDAGAYNKCREPQAEWVSDRERANRCEYFRPSGGGPRASRRAGEAKAKLEGLFKKKDAGGE